MKPCYVMLDTNSKLVDSRNFFAKSTKSKTQPVQKKSINHLRKIYTNPLKSQIESLSINIESKNRWNQRINIKMLLICEQRLLLWFAIVNILYVHIISIRPDKKFPFSIQIHKNTAAPQHHDDHHYLGYNYTRWLWEIMMKPISKFWASLRF